VHQYIHQHCYNGRVISIPYPERPTIIIAKIPWAMRRGSTKLNPILEVWMMAYRQVKFCLVVGSK
jgi:hypothetical protein